MTRRERCLFVGRPARSHARGCTPLIADQSDAQRVTSASDSALARRRAEQGAAEHGSAGRRSDHHTRRGDDGQVGAHGNLRDAQGERLRIRHLILRKLLQVDFELARGQTPEPTKVEAGEDDAIPASRLMLFRGEARQQSRGSLGVRADARHELVATEDDPNAQGRGRGEGGFGAVSKQRTLMPELGDATGRVDAHDARGPYALARGERVGRDRERERLGGGDVILGHLRDSHRRYGTPVRELPQPVIERWTHDAIEAIPLMLANAQPRLELAECARARVVLGRLGSEGVVDEVGLESIRDGGAHALLIRVLEKRAAAHDGHRPGLGQDHEAQGHLERLCRAYCDARDGQCDRLGHADVVGWLRCERDGDRRGVNAPYMPWEQQRSHHRIEATISLREECILSLRILTHGTDRAHAIEQLVCKLGFQIWDPLVSNEAQAERELHRPQVLLVQMTQ